jgi:glutamyl-tRNA reductase
MQSAIMGHVIRIDAIAMTILAYGLNYRTASLDLRERVAFPDETVRESLAKIIREVAAVSETAIISTCNRTELHCAIEADGEHELTAWLAETRQVSKAELEGTTYRHWDQDAAHHLIRVASGLDSQVLGEPQIMGQVKSAYDLARDAGVLGPELNLLSQVTLRAAKNVRTQTEIGRNPISVAYAAVSLAQQIFTDLATKKALLLGAGETIGLVADHLVGAGVGHIAIANRTIANAELLASKYEAEAMQLTEVAERLGEFDIVIASTGSSLPIVGKGAVEAAVKQRRHKPIFMVDIAVPRDIEPEVGELADVYLYSIDDLTNIVESNLAQRRQAAEAAESLVHKGAKHYQRERRIQQGQSLLKDFRGQAKATQEAELESALRELEKGQDAREILARLSHNLTNKLIHTPTIAIRDASAEGRTDLLEYLRSLYALPEADETEDTDTVPPADT